MRKLRVIAFGLLFLPTIGLAFLSWNLAQGQGPGGPVVNVPAQQGFPGEAVQIESPQRPSFTIDPKTPLADLLPPPPKTAKTTSLHFGGDDLAKVREVTFQEPLSRELGSSKASFEIAFQLAKIRHLNQPKTDNFMEKLIDHRSDLQGMPFAMGDACRILGERASYLAAVSALLHRCMEQSTEGKGSPAATLNAETLWTAVWENFHGAEKELVKSQVRLNQEAFDSARVAAAMQILAPESAQVRLGLVKYLSKIPHADATKALAKLALFSTEEEIHLAAVAALKVRREKDYSPILVQGLRYPLATVAKRAADAVVRLECADLVPQLVNMLDEPDPRLPVVRDENGTKVTVVRELVRVNHHRNCMLCHSPAAPDANAAITRLGLSDIVFAVDQRSAAPVTGSAATVTSGAAPMTNAVPPPPKTAEVVKEQIDQKIMVSGGSTVAVVPGLAMVSGPSRPALDLQIPPTAPVPLPTDPLGSVSGGYSGGSPDIMVRIDVTYLRQDFSLMQPVHDAAPWPEMQRFDYMVRTRVLSDKELAELQKEPAKGRAGFTTPYQRAVLFALRELTGRDTGPTGQAWRQLLAIPAKTARH